MAYTTRITPRFRGHLDAMRARIEATSLPPDQAGGLLAVLDQLGSDLAMGFPAIQQVQIAEPQAQHGESRLIPLSRGLNAIVDPEDYESLSQFKWYAIAKPNGATHYAVRSLRREGKGHRQMRVYMHRVLLGAPGGMVVDHQNGDGLDNRRINIRLATGQQNSQNRLRFKKARSRFKGVCWSESCKKWKVRISAAGQRRYIGLFDTEEEAALAYDAAARVLHGEFAATNFPLGATG